MHAGRRKELTETESSHGILLEGDIGGGLAMIRHIAVANDSPKVLQITSSIEARAVGGGSGGFSRYIWLFSIAFWLKSSDLARE